MENCAEEGCRQRGHRFHSKYAGGILEAEGDGYGKKVIAAGHICIDMTPNIKGRRVNSISEILMPGKLVNVGNMTFCTGGSVANTGLAMKILGANVSLMGKTGEDELGNMICDSLKRYQAEQKLIAAPGESTSYTVVIAVPGVDRCFLHHTGANDTSLQSLQQKQEKRFARMLFRQCQCLL